MWFTVWIIHIVKILASSCCEQKLTLEIILKNISTLWTTLWNFNMFTMWISWILQVMNDLQKSLASSQCVWFTVIFKIYRKDRKWNNCNLFNKLYFCQYTIYPFYYKVITSIFLSYFAIKLLLLVLDVDLFSPPLSSISLITISTRRKLTEDCDNSHCTYTFTSTFSNI